MRINLACCIWERRQLKYKTAERFTYVYSELLADIDYTYYGLTLISEITRIFGIFFILLGLSIDIIDK
jgi:hypothetical protein